MLVVSRYNMGVRESEAVRLIANGGIDARMMESSKSVVAGSSCRDYIGVPERDLQ